MMFQMATSKLAFMRKSNDFLTKHFNTAMVRLLSPSAPPVQFLGLNCQLCSLPFDYQIWKQFFQRARGFNSIQLPTKTLAMRRHLRCFRRKNRSPSGNASTSAQCRQINIGNCQYSAIRRFVSILPSCCSIDADKPISIHQSGQPSEISNFSHRTIIS